MDWFKRYSRGSNRSSSTCSRGFHLAEFPRWRRLGVNADPTAILPSLRLKYFLHVDFRCVFPKAPGKSCSHEFTAKVFAIGNRSLSDGQMSLLKIPGIFVSPSLW